MDGDDGAATKVTDAKGLGGQKRLGKQRLDALLFSRGGDQARRGGPGAGEQLPEEEERQDDEARDWEMEVDQLRLRMHAYPVTGDEAWLDCLITAVEHEAEDEFMVTEV